VNVDFFIVIYFIVVYLQKSRFYFSDYLVAKGPVIHRLVGTRLVTVILTPVRTPEIWYFSKLLEKSKNFSDH
jgi:hypothetical protein